MVIRGVQRRPVPYIDHRTPHSDKRLTSYIFLDQKRMADSNQSHTAGRVVLGLIRVLQRINSGNYTPFFERGEIDRLYSDGVLNVYARGRYSQMPLSTIYHWSDLVNNTAFSILSNREFIMRQPAGELRSEAAKDCADDVRAPLRTLKLIEDNIYFHPELQQQIRSMIIGSRPLLAEEIVNNKDQNRLNNNTKMKPEERIAEQQHVDAQIEFVRFVVAEIDRFSA